MFSKLRTFYKDVLTKYKMTGDTDVTYSSVEEHLKGDYLDDIIKLNDFIITESSTNYPEHFFQAMFVGFHCDKKTYHFIKKWKELENCSYSIHKFDPVNKKYIAVENNKHHEEDLIDAVYDIIKQSWWLKEDALEHIHDHFPSYKDTSKVNCFGINPATMIYNKIIAIDRSKTAYHRKILLANSSNEKFVFDDLPKETQLFVNDVAIANNKYRYFLDIFSDFDHSHTILYGLATPEELISKSLDEETYYIFITNIKYFFDRNLYKKMHEYLKTM